MPVPVPWIDAFIDISSAKADAASTFWAAVTGWPAGAAWSGHAEFHSLVPPDGTSCLHVQAIDGPPRVHLDLAGDIVADQARLTGLGARPERRGDGWQVMTSPAGLVFCIYGSASRWIPPSATAWPPGHRSRVMQVCIDVPADQYNAELRFWRAATGWDDEEMNAPEFHRLAHRTESPLQLLIQRLGVDDGAAQPRVHLELGTDDMDAERARVQALGAEELWPGDGFIALRDPVGLPFCIIAQDPDR